MRASRFNSTGLAFGRFRSQRYFPELDGLRAISVLLVISRHTTDPWGLQLHGALGVTVFFVISGFLITTLLLREEIASGAVKIGAFYTRRGFRILPVYTVMLGAHVVIIGVLHLHPGAASFWRSFPYFITYQNDFAPDDGLFGQTWSLAVEEKFYLVWPLAFVSPAVRQHRVRIAGGMLVLFAGASLLGVFLAQYLAIYVPVLAGCLLAVAMNDQRAFGAMLRASSPVALVLLLTALGVQSIFFDNDGQVHVVFAVLMTACLPALLLGKGPAQRLLGSSVMRYLGSRSYALYLDHRMAKGFVDRILAPGSHSTTQQSVRFLLIVGLALAGAEVLFRLVERPMITLGRRVTHSTRPIESLPALEAEGGGPNNSCAPALLPPQGAGPFP